MGHCVSGYSHAHGVRPQMLKDIHREKIWRGYTHVHLVSSESTRHSSIRQQKCCCNEDETWRPQRRGRGEAGSGLQGRSAQTRPATPPFFP